MKLKEMLNDTARGIIMRAISDTGGNLTKAAKIVGVHRVTMYKLLTKYGIALERRKYVRVNETTPYGKYPVKKS